MQNTIDQNLFSEACYKMIGALQGQNGIGTLREKTIHSVLKYYYAPNPAYHEIRIGSAWTGRSMRFRRETSIPCAANLTSSCRSTMSPSSTLSRTPSGCPGSTWRQGNSRQNGNRPRKVLYTKLYPNYTGSKCLLPTRDCILSSA